MEEFYNGKLKLGHDPSQLHWKTMPMARLSMAKCLNMLSNEHLMANIRCASFILSIVCLTYLTYCCQHDLLTKEKIQQYVKRGMIDGVLGLFYGFCCSNTTLYAGPICRRAAINDFNLVHKILGIILGKNVNFDNNKNDNFIQFENRPLMLHKIFQSHLKMTRKCSGILFHMDFDTLEQLLQEFIMLTAQLLEIDHNWKRICGGNVEQLHRLYDNKLIPILKQLIKQDGSKFENTNSFSLSPIHKDQYQKMVQSMLHDNIEAKQTTVLHYLDEIYTHSVGCVPIV